MKYAAQLSLLLLFINGIAMSAEPEPFRDIACPEQWGIDTKIIPVIGPNTNADPWSNDSADKRIAKNHISSIDVIDTIDAVPVTNDQRVDDLLTVASECLAFRNLVVNGDKVYPEAGIVDYRPEFGFIPASVF